MRNTGACQGQQVLHAMSNADLIVLLRSVDRIWGYMGISLYYIKPEAIFYVLMGGYDLGHGGVKKLGSCVGAPFYLLLDV